MSLCKMIQALPIFDYSIRNNCDNCQMFCFGIESSRVCFTAFNVLQQTQGRTQEGERSWLIPLFKDRSASL